VPLLQADNEQAAVARRGHRVHRRVASAASTPSPPPDPPRRVQASFDEQHTVGAELGRAELRPHPALQVGPMLNLLSPLYIFHPHISFVPYLFPPPPHLHNAFEDAGCCGRQSDGRLGRLISVQRELPQVTSSGRYYWPRGRWSGRHAQPARTTSPLCYEIISFFLRLVH